MAAAADSANVIVTPSHGRAVTTPDDYTFIKGSDEEDTPIHRDDDQDVDWEPSNEDRDYDRRHSIVVLNSLETGSDRK